MPDLLWILAIVGAVNTLCVIATGFSAPVKRWHRVGDAIYTAAVGAAAAVLLVQG